MASSFLLECKKCETILCDLQEDLNTNTFDLFTDVYREEQQSVLCSNCMSFLGEKEQSGDVKVYEKNVNRIFIKQNVVDFFLNSEDEEDQFEKLKEEIEKLKKFCVFLYKNQSKKKI